MSLTGVGQSMRAASKPVEAICTEGESNVHSMKFAEDNETSCCT